MKRATIEIRTKVTAHAGGPGVMRAFVTAGARHMRAADGGWLFPIKKLSDVIAALEAEGVEVTIVDLTNPELW